jgi:hypothetical protein
MNKKEPTVTYAGREMPLMQALNLSGIFRNKKNSWGSLNRRLQKYYISIYAKYAAGKLRERSVDELQSSVISVDNVSVAMNDDAATEELVKVANVDEELHSGSDEEHVERSNVLNTESATFVEENEYMFPSAPCNLPVIEQLAENTFSTFLPPIHAHLEENVAKQGEEQFISPDNIASDIPFEELTKLWAMKNNIPFTQMEEYSALLRKHNSYKEFAELRKNWKSVMKVDKDSELRTKYKVEEWGTAEENKRYTYLGIEQRLNQYRGRYIPDGSTGPDDDCPHYEIVMNADGATFGAKGVMKSLWAIQIQVWAVSPAGKGTERRVLDRRLAPHIVALHHASSQPEDFIRFLRDFVDEIKKLDPSNTTDADCRQLTVTLIACICDGPAREKCKCLYGMFGTFPCEKCFSIGVKFGTNCMSNWEARGHLLRTDESFMYSVEHVRAEFDEETGQLEPMKSPLREINYFGMVTGFPLEPMHTVYLGACKNWLKKLFLAKLASEQPLSTPEKLLLDRKLDFVRNFTPSEFQSSRLKPFNHLKKWKAAEMRHFLLYAAIILFKGIVPKGVYQKLCCLLVALYFIGGDSPDPVPEEHLKHAQTLIEKFFHEVSRDHFPLGLPPSLHWLLHVVNDVRFFGCHLERLSAWPFENAMRFMLNSVNSGFKAVEQIINREAEKLEFNLQLDEDGVIIPNQPEDYEPRNPSDSLEKKNPYVKTNHWKRRTLIFPKGCGDFLLKKTKNNRDCHFIYNCGPDRRRDVVVAKFLDVISDEETGDLVIIGQQYLTKDMLFAFPCQSDRFYGFTFKHLSPKEEKFDVANVVGKMYAAPCTDAVFENGHDTDSQKIEKLKLKKYLTAPLPRDAPIAPKAPNFYKLCEAHFDAWEGMAIQHSYKSHQ